MKSPKERQRAYREQRKERKNAGLTKLKILASATTARRMEILSEIDSTDVGNVLGQAVELLWTRRFGSSEIAPASAAKAEKDNVAKPEMENAAKPEKAAKPGKPEKEKATAAEKQKAAKPEKEKEKAAKAEKQEAAKSVKEKAMKSEKPKKSGKSAAKPEPGNPVLAAEH